MLIRFREEEVAFSAAIDDMLYQTRVAPSNTDSLRFLWWPDGIYVSPEENRTRRVQTFVANRVAEIHEKTSPEQWNPIPGAANPADDGSRAVRTLIAHGTSGTPQR